MLEDRMALTRKPFAEFVAECAVYLAGPQDRPFIESARLRIVEAAPGDWRMSMILDHAVEVVFDESYATYEEAEEDMLNRLGDYIRLEQPQ